MMTAESQKLLAEYVAHGSERAFQELVARYIDLVYSAALRLVEGDHHRAQDVAQKVFMDLARMAPKLAPNTLLGGWLHRHTCFVARTLMRGERRRHARERQAAEMSTLENQPDAALAEVAAVLDEAIQELGPDDRDVLLLRFFEQRNLRSVGEALGLNENVAQKRVARALQELALLLRKRGFSLSAGALAAGLTAGAVKAAPAGLALGLAQVALANAGATAGTVGTTAKLALATKLKAALFSGLLVAGLGTILWLQFPSRARQPGAPQLSQASPPASQPNQQPIAPAALPDALPPAQEQAPAQAPQPTPEPPRPADTGPASATQPGPPAPALAQNVAPPGDFTRRFTARAGSQVVIEGTANMFQTRWRVQGEIIQGKLDVGANFPVAPGQASAPGPVTVAADVFIPVTTLKSIDAAGAHFSDAMDSVLYATLKPEVQRKIHFHLTELRQDTAKTNNGPFRFEARGTLAVAGVTNSLALPVQVLPLESNRLEITGATTVRMSDFKLTPPVALNGALKTGDEVKLSLDWIVAPASHSPTASQEMLVPLALDLPAAGYTCQDLSGVVLPASWMEPVPREPRPLLLVPFGLTNLARGAQITCSDKSLPADALSKIIDGDKAADSSIFLHKGVQWVQLDLGSPCEIYAIVLWHAHDAPKAFHAVAVQLADDPDFRQGAKTLFNNDRVNASGLGVGPDREYLETFEGRLINPKGATGQYLRFYSEGSTQSALNEYTEIEVYGRSTQ